MGLPVIYSFSQDNLCILSEVPHSLETDLDSCACQALRCSGKNSRLDLGSLYFFFTFFFEKKFIGVELIYNVVLVSGV